jgi:hypothetical protein
MARSIPPNIGVIREWLLMITASAYPPILETIGYARKHDSRGGDPAVLQVAAMRLLTENDAVKALTLDQARRQGQPDEVGAAAAAGLVSDPSYPRGHSAVADAELRRDLGVSAAAGDEGDQFAFPDGKAG